MAGMINYTITRMIDGIYGKGGYKQYNEAMGILTCVTHEYYRKRITVYEDKKAIENGEVF